MFALHQSVNLPTGDLDTLDRRVPNGTNYLCSISRSYCFPFTTVQSTLTISLHRGSSFDDLRYVIDTFVI